MKIIEAINQLDALKHNTYTQADKVRWLSTLDGMVKNHVVDTHEGAEEVSFTGYDGNTDLQTELLMPAPYDEAYLIWMESKIDYHNGEYGKYNNAVDMFNTAYDSYKAYYNRTHMPKATKFKYFGGSATKKSQQTCPILCDPMNRSMPGHLVHHQTPESTQTHIYRVGDAIQPSHPLSSSSSPALKLSQNQGLFK